ncbi:hypothetical protein CPT_Seuss84 [Caulobacter phage Seuss]|uniref:Uncharacterized protein n=1 Tax=Caulobacter phage Seuss TaxID=1675601 RepID=A0A0K1LN95_9CAUD|nr:hypothetical protein HOR08_gp084 [Caulobacter phage Seuss]AKU43610.1 hypothetical protein CPT_Seuss84 [Caulobacter phage Seuss]
MLDIEIKHQIPSQTLADWVVTAFEGGSAYWCISAPLTTIPTYVPEKDQVGVVRYSHRQVYEGDFQFTVKYDHEEPETKLVGPAEFKAGIEKLALKRGDIFSKLVDPDADFDAGDADVFWQFIVLGEEVYG